MEKVVKNHLILDRILSFLPFEDLAVVRLVCKDFATASLSHFSATSRIDPTTLLLADLDTLHQKVQFLGRIGQVRVFISNLNLSFRSYGLSDFDEEEFGLKYSNQSNESNPTKTLLLLEELSPLFERKVFTLQIETNLAEEIDAVRLLSILRQFPFVESFCLLLVATKFAAYEKFFSAFKEENLLPNLAHFQPHFSVGRLEPNKSDSDFEAKVAAHASALEVPAKVLNLEPYPPASEWIDSGHYKWISALEKIGGKLPLLNTIRAQFGYPSPDLLLQLKQPITRLYLSFWGGENAEPTLVTRILAHFSGTLQLVDITFAFPLKGPLRGARSSLPPLPSLRVFSFTGFSFQNDISGRPPSIDNLDSKEWRDVFTPQMLDPFWIKELILQGKCVSCPKLETLYLLYPHLHGNGIWEYYFPVIAVPAENSIISPLRKLVISRVRMDEEGEWTNFRNQLRMEMLKLERLRCFKKEVGNNENESFFWPVESCLLSEAEVQWEDKGKGVWLLLDDFEFPFLVQFCLRKCSLVNCFVDCNSFEFV